jgi:hypothetical protein
MAIRSTPKRTVAPTSDVVSLAEVKSWMKVDITDDDELIQSLIVAAQEAAELYLRKALITQTWTLTIDLGANSLNNSLGDGIYDLPVTALYGDMPNEIDLPYKPIQSITSVVTYNTSNESATYASTNYFVDTASGRLILNDTAVWPSSLRNRVSAVVTYVAGYTNASSIPQSIRTAIMMHIQRMYDERIMCDLPVACQSLLRQHREYTLNG